MLKTRSRGVGGDQREDFEFEKHMCTDALVRVQKGSPSPRCPLDQKEAENLRVKLTSLGAEERGN